MSPDEIIGIIAAAACLVQLYYMLAYFSRLAFYKAGKSKETLDFQPVSVIIVARNEHKNLQKNLKVILEQDYPDYEVIVVNNGSWDKSQEYLEQLEEHYAHLKLVKIIEQEKYPKGKKFGLTLGIKAASNEWLLLTDSDCQPAGKNWISSMRKHFVQDTSIVLGYSPYHKKPGVLNLFIRFETFQTALQYLSFALNRKAYMGVGRNLAYRKSLFFSVKGFASHNHIISGDDDLFVNETADQKNTAVCIDPEAFVYSDPKEDFNSWYRQKTRHLHTGKYYNTSSKALLAGLSLSHLLFYSALITGFFITDMPYILLIIYGLRLLFQLVIYGCAMKKLRENTLIYFLPLLDLLYFFYYLLLGIRTLFSGKRKTWML
jgi:biofilm PGA synthesis N-glycosyltransferase PgaC